MLTELLGPLVGRHLFPGIDVVRCAGVQLLASPQRFQSVLLADLLVPVPLLFQLLSAKNIDQTFCNFLNDPFSLG